MRAVQSCCGSMRACRMRLVLCTTHVGLTAPSVQGAMPLIHQCMWPHLQSRKAGHDGSGAGRMILPPLCPDLSPSVPKCPKHPGQQADWSGASRAFCYIKLGAASVAALAVEDCDTVLSSQPENAKALFRRGQARLLLKVRGIAGDDSSWNENKCLAWVFALCAAEVPGVVKAEASCQPSGVWSSGRSRRMIRGTGGAWCASTQLRSVGSYCSVPLSVPCMSSPAGICIDTPDWVSGNFSP